MKTIICLFGLFFINTLYTNAQFYEVNDTDGYVNVRSHPNLNSAVVCRLDNQMIVQESYREDTSGGKNWVHVDFYLPSSLVKKNKIPHEDYSPPIMTGYKLASGFIYKSRLVEIEALDMLESKNKQNEIRFYNKNVSLTIVIGIFNVKAHHSDFEKEIVDGLPMIGTDGTRPHDEIRKIEMTINKISVPISYSLYKNLFEPNLDGSNVFTDGKSSFYLVMYNSDAAGSYSCIFIFRNGKLTGRWIFNGEC